MILAFIDIMRPNGYSMTGASTLHNLGDYYRLDVGKNVVVDTHVDLDALGRELKVLAPGSASIKRNARADRFGQPRWRIVHDALHAYAKSTR